MIAKLATREVFNHMDKHQIWHDPIAAFEPTGCHTDTAAAFLEDAKSHKIAIAQDDGVYRRIVCQKPGTCVHAFEVVTWPGYLAITGDMGSGMFSRELDMFTFFEGRDAISPEYWSEKLKRDEECEKVKSFSKGAFISHIRTQLVDQLDQVLDDEFGHIFSAEGNCSHACGMEPIKLRIDTDGIGLVGYEWTHHHLWRLWAIVWTIKQYRAIKSVAGD